MRPLLVSSVFALFTLFISPSNGLRAITSSPCASRCGNVLDSTTGEDDVVCYDREFGTTSKGALFQGCISCQLESKYVDTKTKETDLQWGLYNLRWAVSWCLFGYPNNTAVGGTPCITTTACGTLQNAFEFDSLSANASAYGYCALMSMEIVPKCTSCTAQGDEFFLTNYITALAAACQQQPIPGSTIFIEGNVFSKTRTNITSPSDAATATNQQTHSSGGLALGAKVGIAVAAIVVFLAVLGCCIIWRGKQRRRKILQKRQRESGYADWVSARAQSLHSPNPMSAAPRSGGTFFDSPQSQKPLYGDPNWGRGVREEESPQQTHMAEKPYFSPYSSQYSSPVSAVDQIQVVGREWPMDRRGSAAAAGTTGVLGKPPQGRSRSREKKEFEGDRIEMQNVAPVLLHPLPGQGRVYATPHDADVKGNGF